jgi:hypothetical protein
LRDAGVDSDNDSVNEQPIDKIQPKPVTKKRVRREASEVSIELLEVEKENRIQMKRIADSLEEFVRLKKTELGITDVIVRLTQ